MEVYRQTGHHLNLSTETEVLTFTYTGTIPREFIARVDLGDDATPIIGSGPYLLRIFINNIHLAPASRVTVEVPEILAKMASRAIPLDPGDLLSVRVTGLPGDLAVNTVASLRDATPIRATDVNGAGTVAVDHNYGGTDALTVTTPSGARVEGATIRAYRAEDYSSGNRGNAFIVATTVTDVDGHWRQPLMLSPGSYTLLVYKTGVIITKAIALTVA